MFSLYLCFIIIIMSFVASPITDLLIRIKNAAMARKRTISWVLYSKFKIAVLDLLAQYNFVESYTIKDEWNNKKFISIIIKQVKDPINDIPVIKMRSTPSRPWYISAKEIKSVAGGRGIWIMSTNKWLMASHVAKKQWLGWLLIADIY